MLSIGELIDKLIIEDIKIFNIREKLHSTKDENETTSLNEKMMILNSNRSIIIDFLNDKIENVKKGQENRILKTFKTYE